MPRRRPECGAARAVGGTGPGGPVRQPELQRYRGAGARREAGSPKRGGKPGRRCEKRDADAGRKERRRRHPHRVARTGRKAERRSAVRAAETSAGQDADAGATEEPAGKHTPPQRRAQDRVRMPEPQRDPQESTRRRRDARRTGCGCRSRRGPQDRARMPKPPRSPPKPRKRPGRRLAPEGRPSPQRAMQNENRIRAAGRLPPDFRPTSARLSQGAQEPHREHRTAQTAPPEKIRARGFTASGSSVRLVRLMRVGESHVSIHKDNSGLR